MPILNYQYHLLLSEHLRARCDLDQLMDFTCRAFQGRQNLGRNIQPWPCRYIILTWAVLTLSKSEHIMLSSALNTA